MHAGIGRPTIATIAAITIVFAWLGFEIPQGRLVNTDELLTAERTREMLLLGQSSVHLNFERSFNKPPLQYWMGAITLGHLSDRELALRIWPLLFGLLTVICIAWFARTIKPEQRWVGFVAVVILVSCPIFLAEVSRALLDSGLMLFTTFAVAFSQLARKRPAWWLATAIACCFGALQKIPFVHLVWVFILIARFTSPNERRNLNNPWLGASILVSIIGLLAWPAIQTIRYGCKFSDAFQLGDAKIMTGPQQLGQHLFFQVPLELIAFWPFGIIALVAPIYYLLQPRSVIDPVLRELSIIFVGVLLLALIFGFRSVRYLLPVIPCIVVVLAVGICKISMRRPDRFRYTSVLVVLLCVAGIIIGEIRIRTRRRDVADEIVAAQHLSKLQKPGVNIFVVRNHQREISYQTFYLFYGDLRLPVRELFATQIHTAEIREPAIGVCATRDFASLERKLTNVTVDLQAGHVFCWRAGAE